MLAQPSPRGCVQSQVDDWFRVEPRSWHGNKRAERNQKLNLSPKMQLTQRVRTDDKIKLRAWLAPSQFRQGVHRVRLAAALGFDIVNHKVGVVTNREGDHPQPVPFAGQLVNRLVRRRGRRDEPQLVEPQLFHGVLGDEKMAEVNRVKRPPEDPNALAPLHARPSHRVRYVEVCIRKNDTIRSPRNATHLSFGWTNSQSPRNTFIQWMRDPEYITLDDGKLTVGSEFLPLLQAAGLDSFDKIMALQAKAVIRAVPGRSTIRVELPLPTGRTLVGYLKRYEEEYLSPLDKLLRLIHWP